MIRVLLVDDHHLIRAGIKQLLESAENITIVGEADCGEAALELLKNIQVDIAVVDLHMPGMAAQDLITILLNHTPSIRSVILTSIEEESTPSRLLNNGASSYVTKSCESEHLLQAIEKAMQGEYYISPDMAQRLAYKVMQQPKNLHEGSLSFKHLSAREMQCLRLIVAGKSIKEIAETLDINAKTINTYRYRIFQKLHITNDVDLIKLVARSNLLDD